MHALERHGIEAAARGDTRVALSALLEVADVYTAAGALLDARRALANAAMILRQAGKIELAARLVERCIDLPAPDEADMAGVNIAGVLDRIQDPRAAEI